MQDKILTNRIKVILNLKHQNWRYIDNIYRGAPKNKPIESLNLSKFLIKIKKI